AFSQLFSYQRSGDACQVLVRFPIVVRLGRVHKKSGWQENFGNNPESARSRNSDSNASRRLPLQNLGGEFAVAEAGANFYLWTDCGDRPDDFSAFVHRDAVTAAQGRVRTQHAQDSFDALETVPRALQQLCWRSNQAPMQIRETISSHRELARGIACLYRARDVGEVALITVDLVREA